jgi:hypothetical protein
MSHRHVLTSPQRLHKHASQALLQHKLPVVFIISPHAQGFATPQRLPRIWQQLVQQRLEQPALAVV